MSDGNNRIPFANHNDRAFHYYRDSICEEVAMTPDELANSLFENILAAQEMLFREQINANTVVLNGNKFAKWVKPGYRPTIFGMAVEYDNLPEDIDFLVQYKEPKPMTNADRIRVMTDRELARFLSFQVPGREYIEHAGMRLNHWLEWLKEEIDE